METCLHYIYRNIGMEISRLCCVMMIYSF